MRLRLDYRRSRQIRLVRSSAFAYEVQLLVTLIKNTMDSKTLKQAAARPSEPAILFTSNTRNEPFQYERSAASFFRLDDLCL